MNQALVDRVVNAILYEGYVLYPYRPAVKDRQRWTFAGLYPQAYGEAHGKNNAWAMQTECLVRGDDETRVRVTIRFLHPSDRRVCELDRPVAELPDGPEPAHHVVEWLQVGDRLRLSCQEAEEREQPAGEFALGALAAAGSRFEFHFPAGRTVEPVRGPAGDVIAVLIRERYTLSGRIEVTAEPVAERLYRVRVRIENRTRLDDPGRRTRDEALMRALVSPHTILAARGGAFVSLMDPPDEDRAAAAACQNVGTWPVLVGEAGVTDTMLSSPVILYDYPAVAAEKPADRFPGIEADETLYLRVPALAAVDDRVRALLQRAEALEAAPMAQGPGRPRGLRASDREAS
jgi:hypothetical protein